jgi:effector-binding domain-containing protein
MFFGAMMTAASQEKSTLGEITIETQEAMVALMAKGGGTPQTLSQELGKIFGLVMGALQTQGLQMAGPPFAHYLDFDESTGYTNFLAGAQVAGSAVGSGEVEVVKFDKMKVARAIHTGSYEQLSVSYGKFEKYLESNGLETTGEVFEFYLTDPGTEPDQSKWQTLIAFPLK